MGKNYLLQKKKKKNNVSMSEKKSINSSFNEEEENPEHNESQSDVDMNEENNAMYNSALNQSGSIDIGGERYQYGKQDKYLLGVHEEGYTLKKLCQVIIENQKYLFRKDQEEAVEPPSHILKKDEAGYFLVHFSLNNVCYRPSRCYKMSDDNKALYAYDKDNKSVVTATYYDNDNDVYVTKNRNIIDNLLLKHKVEFDDDVLPPIAENRLNKSFTFAAKNLQQKLLSSTEEEDDDNNRRICYCYSEGSNAFNYEKNDEEEANNEEQYNKEEKEQYESEEHHNNSSKLEGQEKTQQTEQHPWSDVGGYNLSWLDCCNCFGKK